jgi:hypothetical protein
VLVYERSANLGRRVVIDAIGSALSSIDDPLEKLWIEDASARRRTYDVTDKRPFPGDQADFRYLWAIPRSERRNSKSRWLTAAMIDNVAVDSSILFFAIPRGAAPEFMTHRILLELLVRAGISPRYGYGSACQYDKPAYFAFDYAYNNRVPTVAHAEWARACAPSPRPGGQPHVLTPILDVFPLNVLTDIHLRQKTGQASFKDWIVQTTGSNSLTQIGPGCSAWSVPSSQIASVAAKLKLLGLTIDRSQQPASLPEPIAPGSALRAAPVSVCSDPARYDPAPKRSHNRMAPTADRPVPLPRREGAPAAIERASPASLLRRSGSH